MNIRLLLPINIATLLLVTAVTAVAADQDAPDRRLQQIQEQDRLQSREQVYGSQLMTPEERIEYRNKMRSMKTEQEREAFRLEHHQQMQQRALERGQVLPDMPSHDRGGMGPGSGQGRGR